MKTALIGDGKTGGYVKKLLEDEEVIVFNEDNKPTAEELRKCDVAIIFVPGIAAGELIDPVLTSGIPAAWGTTGYRWPEDLPDKVKVAGAKWVIASNFSLGMNIMRKCLEAVGKGSHFLKDPEFHIHEIHHKDKLDAPSGTALKWQEWLGVDNVQISYNREGDVKGIHSLHVKTDYESLFLKHEAHDRAVFAHGAIWAARFLTNNTSIMPGMYSFESIIDLAFSNET
jgi:4-hydroxy-tetrahydrodipicolinate reductase